MALATCFRGGQRRGKRGSGVWTCCGQVASVRMACFTLSASALASRARPWHHGHLAHRVQGGEEVLLPRLQEIAVAADEAVLLDPARLLTHE